MRRLSEFSISKGVASAFPVLASNRRPPSTDSGNGELTLADVAARIGEDNETLRNLLIDTGHHINALEELKGTFEKLVEPISKTLRTLELEKSDNASLRDALAEMRSNHETLHTEFHARGKKSEELEHDNDRLRRELTFAQQSTRELEGNKTDLTAALVTARTAIADLERQLGHETASSRALGEEHRVLLDHANAADKRIVELEAGVALTRQNLSLLENDKATLQASLDQTLAEASRLSRRLTESDNALTAARARLEQLDSSLSAAEEERKKLSAACDEANERRQSECYALNLKV